MKKYLYDIFTTEPKFLILIEILNSEYLYMVITQ